MLLSVFVLHLQVIFNAVSIDACKLIGVWADETTETMVSATTGNNGNMVLLTFFDSRHFFQKSCTKQARQTTLKTWQSIAPITTVAKGLCTSAPAPLLTAIGKNPNDATNAVINTGLNGLCPHQNDSPYISQTFFFLKIKFCQQYNSVKHGHPKQRNKPTPALMLKGISLKARNNIPPMADKGIAE